MTVVMAEADAASGDATESILVNTWFIVSYKPPKKSKRSCFVSSTMDIYNYVHL